MRKLTVTYFLLLVLIHLLNLDPSLRRLSCFSPYIDSHSDILQDFGSHCCATIIRPAPVPQVDNIIYL